MGLTVDVASLPLRVLIVSYGFPPSQAIGHIRVGKLAKYLLRNGCDVRVVTAHPDCLPFPPLLEVEIPEERIVRVRFPAPVRVAPTPAVTVSWRTTLHQVARRLGRRVPRPNYSRLPDRARPWYGPAEAAGHALIGHWRPDVLFSSSGPAGAHVVASRLARRHALPWVADFRDLWTNNPVVAYPRWLDALERRFERAVIAGATRLVTVSQPLADELQRTHGKPVDVLFNGFDPDDFGEVCPPSGPFVLTYTGQAEPGTRDPATVFAAVAQLAARGVITPTDFRLQFIGGTTPAVLHGLSDRHGIREFLDVIGTLPYAQSIRRQQESAALLTLNIAVPDAPGMLSGKLLEYLGAQRPILATGPADPAVSAVLAQTGAGEWADEPTAIASILERYLRHHRRRTPATQVSDDALAPFSRAAQGARLAAILRATSSPRPRAATAV